MPNVFISYSRRDRERVIQLADALQDEGLSVWWDPNLVPGRKFRQMIAEQLASADCVVVVWTAASLESDWVQDEAEEALGRGALIPVMLEPVKPPAGFRQVQSADLSQWTGSRQHPEFRALVQAAKALAEMGRRTADQAAPKPGQTLEADAERQAATADGATFGDASDEQGSTDAGAHPAAALDSTPRPAVHPAATRSRELGREETERVSSAPSSLHPRDDAEGGTELRPQSIFRYGERIYQASANPWTWSLLTLIAYAVLIRVRTAHFPTPLPVWIAGVVPLASGLLAHSRRAMALSPLTKSIVAVATIVFCIIVLVVAQFALDGLGPTPRRWFSYYFVPVALGAGLGGSVLIALAIETLWRRKPDDAIA